MTIKKKITPKLPAAVSPAEVTIHRVRSRKSTFESALLMGAGTNSAASGSSAVGSNALEYEDSFTGVYGLAGTAFGADSSVVITAPPFNPLTLEKLVKHNNSLGPCIEAMVTNIDGTGYEVAAVMEDAPGAPPSADVKSKLQILKNFFDQPYPGVSFKKIRKDLRRDMESVGYGFLEIIRNLAGEIVFLRHVDARTMRLVRLDHAVPVPLTIMRGGVEREMTVMLRYRRFVQQTNLKYVFFKEFNAQLELNKNTGKWATADTPVAPQDRATEIMYFTVDADVNTPYGVPRWIAQLPSVLGSRQAEENNLDFFDSGGIPPFLIIVQGGILAQETKDALDSVLSSDPQDKMRGLVVEAHSTSGSLNDSGNNVNVQVEKFGSEQTNDSQFETYDTRCEGRVRGAFRLSALFTGRSDTFNYATAFASYMLAEAQVFGPARSDFDEVISLQLIPALLKNADPGVVYRSLPLVVNDAKEKVMAIQLAGDKQAISKGELVSNLNQVTGLTMKVADGEADTICPPAGSKPEGGPNGNSSGLNTDSQMTDASTRPPTGGDKKPK